MKFSIRKLNESIMKQFTSKSASWCSQFSRKQQNSYQENESYFIQLGNTINLVFHDRIKGHVTVSLSDVSVSDEFS